jgi:hypothetical protein
MGSLKVVVVNSHHPKEASVWEVVGSQSSELRHLKILGRMSEGEMLAMVLVLAVDLGILLRDLHVACAGAISIGQWAGLPRIAMGWILPDIGEDQFCCCDMIEIDLHSKNFLSSVELLDL